MVHVKILAGPATVLLAACVAFTSLGAPGIAHGAPSKSSTTAKAAAAAVANAPLASGPIEVQIWPGQNESNAGQPGNSTVVIVDVNVPSQVKLPVKVRIPIVAGVRVDWTGEILGSTAQGDTQRPYTTGTGAGGGKYVEFTLQTSHKGQVDTIGVPMTSNGTKRSANVDWIQSVPATSVLFSVRLPAGISNPQFDPPAAGTPLTNTSGETLYTLNAVAPKLGGKQTVKVAYDVATPFELQAQQRSSQLTTIYIVLLVALVLVIGVLIWAVARQRARMSDQVTEEPEEDEDSDIGPDDDDQPDEHPGPAHDEDVWGDYGASDADDPEELEWGE